ncbi:MAG: sulfur oxidation c-type cytochrome SoxA [bacterium]
MKLNAVITVLGLLISTPVAFAFEPISGYEFISPETQAMQDDDFENPGYLTVEEGHALFTEHRQDEEYACADCHGKNGDNLDTKRIASYPIYDENLGGLVTLQNRINNCWEMNMDRFPLVYDDRQLVALETFIKNLAHGETINVQTDGDMAPLLKEAEKLYQQRFGQLDMSCAHCHIQHLGQMLRGQKLSQGQGNGFPEYRLGKGEITSLHKRLKQCFISFRADPFDAGSREFKLLELYIMSRGNGLTIETPAVRF